MNIITGPRDLGTERWLNEVNKVCGQFQAEVNSVNYSCTVGNPSTQNLSAAIISYDEVRFFRRKNDALNGHDERCFFLISQLTGTSQMAQGEQSAHLKPGDLILIDSNEHCSFKPVEPSSQLSFCVSEESVIRSLRSHNINTGQTLSSQQPLVKMASRWMTDIYGLESNISSLEVSAVLDGLIAMLAPALLKRAEPKYEKNDQFLHVVEFIEQNIRHPYLSPEYISEKMSMSPRSLYRLFSKKNVLVARYIKERRLSRCADAIRQAKNDDKIYLIGYDFGFTDPSYFSVIFKKYFGLSPSDYRRKYVI